jgi:hypothetical protein
VNAPSLFLAPIRLLNKGEGKMLNIILGIIFIIGGLSGELVFIGTNSGLLLAGVGVLLVIWGAYRLYQKRQT